MMRYINLMRGIWNMCCFVFGTLWNQMRSSSPKHHMIGFTLLPKNKRAGLPLTNWTTQTGWVACPTALYLHLDHKEANIRFIVSHMYASQFRQFNTTLRFIHMEGGVFSTNSVRLGSMRMVWGRMLPKKILLDGLMYKQMYFLNQANMSGLADTEEVRDKTISYQ